MIWLRRQSGISAAIRFAAPPPSPLPEANYVARQYDTEGFKGGPQSGPHYSESHEPIGQLMWVFPYWSRSVFLCLRHNRLINRLSFDLEPNGIQFGQKSIGKIKSYHDWSNRNQKIISPVLIQTVFSYPRFTKFCSKSSQILICCNLICCWTFYLRFRFITMIVLEIYGSQSSGH